MITEVSFVNEYTAIMPYEICLKSNQCKQRINSLMQVKTFEFLSSLKQTNEFHHRFHHHDHHDHHGTSSPSPALTASTVVPISNPRPCLKIAS